jgi:hypothetical protein
MKLSELTTDYIGFGFSRLMTLGINRLLYIIYHTFYHYVTYMAKLFIKGQKFCTYIYFT